MNPPEAHHVVIVGGGFGGLYAAQALGTAPVRITLVDRRNFHLFQPLLYQVATGSLSPGDIASPIRAVLARFANTEVIKDEVLDLDPHTRTLLLREGMLRYDTLILATGSTHSYFGHAEWEPFAPGLKTLEDALTIRRRILMAYELAEREPDERRRRALMTFVLVGAGPTGVELAGTLGELARATLTHDFRHIDPRQSRIQLLEGAERILPAYPASLSARAQRDLERLGVTVRTRTLVTGIQAGCVSVRGTAGDEQIEAATILWSAGVQVSPLGALLGRRTGAPFDRAGRVRVQRDLSVPGHPEILVVGDLATLEQYGAPLAAIAPVAMQQGEYAARLIRRRLRGRAPPPFHYFNKGTLAVIGRNAAVADFGLVRLSGVLAWFIWAFVHIFYLIEFDNKLLVMIQWMWYYFTRKRGARLITYEEPALDTRVAQSKPGA